MGASKPVRIHKYGREREKVRDRQKRERERGMRRKIISGERTNKLVEGDRHRERETDIKRDRYRERERKNQR